MSSSGLHNKDLFEVLGVDEDATQDEVKRAFRALALQYHPDKVTESGDVKENEERFQEIQAAYDILRDEEKRKQYEREKKRRFFEPTICVLH